MSDNELLLALSDMMDKKLQPMNEKLRNIELKLENDIQPRLQNIESCYTSTYDRYRVHSSDYDRMQQDVELLKKVVQEHSAKLRQFA